jgi:hypothetical protein
MSEILKPLFSDLSANGYIELPGGLILQWGSLTVNNTATVTLPIAFPNACLIVTASGGSAVDSTTSDSVFVESAIVNTSSIWLKVIKGDSTLGNRAVRWFAIGH